MASPFEARYSFGDGSVQAAVDVRNGRIFKLIASKSYQGGFGAIHLGMLVSDAMLADPRLHYSEAEECILCRGVSGITVNVPVIDPDPSEVPALRISDITVYAVEIETLEGQDGLRSGRRRFVREAVRCPEGGTCPIGALPKEPAQRPTTAALRGSRGPIRA